MHNEQCVGRALLTGAVQSFGELFFHLTSVPSGSFDSPDRTEPNLHAMHGLLKLLLAVAACASCVRGNGSGAPKAACATMTPGHSPNQVEAGEPAPYEIMAIPMDKKSRKVMGEREDSKRTPKFAVISEEN